MKLTPFFLSSLCFSCMLFGKCNQINHIFLCLFSEPGYYEDGKFGIRLETIVMTTEVETPVSIVIT